MMYYVLDSSLNLERFDVPRWLSAVAKISIVLVNFKVIAK
jgi:hypothetical protein